VGTPDASLRSVEAIDSVVEDSMPVASADVSAEEIVEMDSSNWVDVVVGPRPSSLPPMHCSAIDYCQ
jgi:hypothetical protein